MYANHGDSMHKIKLGLWGVIIGCINSLLGTGGGLLAVPILKKAGLEQKEAQVNSLAVLFPISIFSMIIYVKNQYVNFFNGLSLFPVVFLGALLGTFLFPKIPKAIFQKIFSVLLLYGGIKMLLSL